MSKYGKKGGGIGKVIGCLLLVVIIGLGASWGTGYALTGEANPVNWRKAENSDETDKSAQIVAFSSDGTPMEQGGSYAMPAGLTYTAKQSEYAPSGEITLTASLDNEYINAKYDWSVNFADPSTTWAADKIATNYVTVTPLTDGGNKAHITYLNAFAEQLIITVSLRGSTSESSSDTCTVDCIKAVTMKDPSLDCTDFSDGACFGIDLEFGVGTVQGRVEFDTARLYVYDDFQSAVQDYLTFQISYKSAGVVSDEKVLKIEPYQGNFIGFLDIKVDGNYFYFDYSDFIKDFDTYDDAHKDAIKYAWYHAYADKGGNYSNLIMDVDFSYHFQNSKISGFAESDYRNCCLYGEEGYYIEPSVTLNKNVAFKG